MRYFIGFFLTIFLIILVIILIFRGGGNKPQAPQTTKTLDSYASTSAEVRLTIDGPINAETLHQQVQITVNKNNATFEHIQGYNGNVVRTERFNNTENGYEN